MVRSFLRPGHEASLVCPVQSRRRSTDSSWHGDRTTAISLIGPEHACMRGFAGCRRLVTHGQARRQRFHRLIFPTSAHFCLRALIHGRNFRLPRFSLGNLTTRQLSAHLGPTSSPCHWLVAASGGQTKAGDEENAVSAAASLRGSDPVPASNKYRAAICWISFQMRSLRCCVRPSSIT